MYFVQVWTKSLRGYSNADLSVEKYKFALYSENNKNNWMDCNTTILKVGKNDN